ncbi:hypothetical protein D3C87_125010 [compost metagenome]
MKLTPVARLVIESGILLGLLSGAIFAANISFKQDAQASQITKLENTDEVLTEKLMKTQLKMAEDITEIKTILKQQTK